MNDSPIAAISLLVLLLLQATCAAFWIESQISKLVSTPWILKLATKFVIGSVLFFVSIFLITICSIRN
jgi:hypothetical protein